MSESVSKEIIEHKTADQYQLKVLLGGYFSQGVHGKINTEMTTFEKEHYSRWP